MCMIQNRRMVRRRYGADDVNKCQSYVFVDMRVGTVGVADGSSSADHNSGIATSGRGEYALVTRHRTG